MSPAETPEADTCSNGHPWTDQTTRWRTRIRDGHTSRERDCLRCKRTSENKRRQARRAELRGAA
jgi:hypothetical protein